MLPSFTRVKQTGSLMKAKQALGAGSALLPSNPSMSLAAGSSRPSPLYADTLPRLRSLQGSCLQLAGFYFCLSAPASYCSSLVLSASHHQRTPHLRGEKHTVQLVRPLVFFSTLRTGSHLTEDSHRKDEGIKLLSGHENTANDHLFLFSNTQTYSWLFVF